MPSFIQRSHQKELLDRDDIPFPDIKKNMQELDRINTLLGGHKITLKGFKELAKGKINSSLQIVEIGCGGGDNLRQIRNWAQKNQAPVQLTGIDINPECIAYARSVEENKDIHFICCDYRDAIFEEKPSIIFSSLFCHHFTDAELVFMLQWMKDNSRLGFFINDLHRNPLAYYSIRILTRLFSHSYLVKNDAPLSVLRGFKRSEWEALLKNAGIHPTFIRWQWAFRWLIIVSC